MQLLLLIGLIRPILTLLPPSDCDAFLFGPNCDYACHCIDLTCDDNGECTETPLCEIGFFGPGCQYEDLAITSAPANVDNTFTDNDEVTCNPNTKAKSWTFRLYKSFRFSWMRLDVNDMSKADNLNIKLNKQSNSCTNMRKFTVSSHTLEIICETTLFVNSITIDGDLAGHICNIHISGGRNVAIRQNVTQSSTEDPTKGTAANAVDGTHDNNYNTTESCSVTLPEAQGAEWIIKFKRPQLLYRVYLLNRLHFEYKSTGFTLSILNKDGKVIENYTDTSDILKDSTVEFNLNSVEPVESVMFRASVKPGVTDGSIHICEVELYGETICPEGFFGVRCQNQCNCTQFQYCSPISGLCDTGCDEGFYGFQCKSECPATCINNMCSVNSGNCEKCKGANCTTRPRKCHQGVYGKDCKTPCPKFCLDATCDPVTGDCYNCLLTHSGPKCEESSMAWVYIAAPFLIIFSLLTLVLIKFKRKKPVVTGGG